MSSRYELPRCEVATAVREPKGSRHTALMWT